MRKKRRKGKGRSLGKGNGGVRVLNSDITITQSMICNTGELKLGN